MTKLATELRVAIDALYRKARVDALDHATTQDPANYLLVEDLKQLRRHSQVLVRHLEAGASEKDTERLYRRLQNLVERARAGRRNSPLLVDAQAEIDQARGLFDTLGDYYGKTPAVAAPPPEAGQ